MVSSSEERDDFWRVLWLTDSSDSEWKKQDNWAPQILCGKKHLDFLVTGCELIITVQGTNRNKIIVYLLLITPTTRDLGTTPTTRDLGTTPTTRDLGNTPTTRDLGYAIGASSWGSGAAGWGTRWLNPCSNWSHNAAFSASDVHISLSIVVASLLSLRLLSSSSLLFMLLLLVVVVM